MAVDFGHAHTNYFSRASSVLSASAPRPMTCCVRYRSGGNAAESNVLSWIYSNNFGSSAPRFGLAIRDVGGNARLSLYSGNYADGADNVTLSTTAHKPCSWRWDTDDTVDFFYDGSKLPTAGTRAIGGNTTDGAAIGTLTGSTGAFDVDGELAEFALWAALLTDDETLAYHAGFSPRLIRPGALQSHVPMLTDGGQDTVLGSWTSNGTLNDADHPPVILPAGPMIGHNSAAVPATFPGELLGRRQNALLRM